MGELTRSSSTQPAARGRRIASERGVVDALEQLDAVAERVVDVALPEAVDAVAVADVDPGGRQAVAERVEIVDEQRGVGLAGRTEVGLDAEVHLDRSVVEPAAAARREVGRLGDVRDAEEPVVERDRRVLLARRHRQLDVIDRADRHQANVAQDPLSRIGTRSG